MLIYKETKSMHFKSTILFICLSLTSITNKAAGVEFTVNIIKEITSDGAVVVMVKSSDGQEVIPVAVQLLGIRMPTDPTIREQFLSSLRYKTDPTKNKLKNLNYRIYSPEEKFQLNQHGILIGIVDRNSSKSFPDGNSMKHRDIITGELLEDGLCTYDGSLEGRDKQVHDIYTKCQALAKQNGQGIWKE